MSPKPYTHKDAVEFRPLDWTGRLPARHCRRRPFPSTSRS